MTDKLFEGYIVAPEAPPGARPDPMECASGYKGSGFPKIYTSPTKAGRRAGQRLLKVGVYIEEEDG